MIVLSLVICLLGLLMYCFARPDQPKAAEVGRIMFWVGLLVFLWGDDKLLVFFRR